MAPDAINLLPRLAQIDFVVKSARSNLFGPKIINKPVESIIIFISASIVNLQ